MRQQSLIATFIKLYSPSRLIHISFGLIPGLQTGYGSVNKLQRTTIPCTDVQVAL